MKIKDWKKTYWEDEAGNTMWIKDVLLDLQEIPAVEIKLSDLAHIPPVYIEEHRKLAADLSCPIIVQEKNGEYKSILDGHHRRQKAIDENRTSILGKIYKGEVVDESE